MKNLSLIGMVIGLVLLNSSCSSLRTSTSQPMEDHYQINQRRPPMEVSLLNPPSFSYLTDPITIQVYPHEAEPRYPFTVLAIHRIPRYNAAGIKRQKANIHDTLRHLAALAGGNAVIHVKQDPTHVTGTIIAYNHYLSQTKQTTTSI